VLAHVLYIKKKIKKPKKLKIKIEGMAQRDNGVAETTSKINGLYFLHSRLSNIQQFLIVLA
jgi:hypothetical protein